MTFTNEAATMWHGEAHARPTGAPSRRESLYTAALRIAAPVLGLSAAREVCYIKVNRCLQSTKPWLKNAWVCPSEEEASASHNELLVVVIVFVVVSSLVVTVVAVATETIHGDIL